MSEAASKGGGDKKKSQTPIKPRYAVALYDFLGATDQRTLTVFKGDVLRIKEVTDGQWWLGECNGVLGFVPRTYVCLKDVNWTPDSDRQISMMNSSSGANDDDTEFEEKDNKDDDLTDDDDDEDKYTIAVVATYNFEKKDPRHLPFKKHDKFFVAEPLTPDQPWLEARFNGQEGLVPANRVYILKPGETEAPKKKKEGEQEKKQDEAEDAASPSRKKLFVKAVALRDYKAPNGDLSFTKGDVVEVESSNSSDWWPARFNGKQGVIPKEFVRVTDTCSSSDVKKELMFNFMTGNREPSRSSCFGNKDIRDVPFFAALFALKSGVPMDSDVEQAPGAGIGDRMLSTIAGNREGDDDKEALSKTSTRLTNIVNAVRATREATSRDQSEEGTQPPANAKGAAAKPSTNSNTVTPRKKATMTIVSAVPNQRKTEVVQAVTDKEVKTVEKFLRFHFLPEGATIFQEGNDDDSLRSVIAILEGEVDIKVAGENYGTLATGQFFGLDSLMVEGSKRTFTAIAKSKMTILVTIPFSGHRALCKAINWYEDAMRGLYKMRNGSSLQRLALFHRLDAQSLDYLGMRFAVRKIRKGQGVLESDDEFSNAVAKGPTTPALPGSGTAGQVGTATPALEEGLFLVLSGLLSVTVKLTDGTKRELRRMGPGQFFGEGALGGLEAQVGIATALVPSLVLYLSKTDLKLYSNIDPKVRAEVARVARFRTADAMRTLPLLEVVPAVKHDVLAAAFEYCIKREGEEFYAPGQNECMYIVCDGEVELQDDRGDSVRTLRQGMWFGEKTLTTVFDVAPGNSGTPPRGTPQNDTSDGMDGSGETPIAHNSGYTLCIALSRGGFERFMETAPEIKPQLKQSLQTMIIAQQDPSSAFQMKNLIPTSADELACVTQLPSEFLTTDPEAKAALESWAEIGKVMAPCLKALQGYPQYLHPVPFDFGGRDPLKKFIVTIVKVDDRMDSIKIATSASETVGELVNNIFKKFSDSTSGMSLDPAGPTLFALKVASRADYLLERDVELGRYKCVTAALRRELVHGELRLALVDLRSNPKSGPGLRRATKRQQAESTAAEGTLMEAIALYDHEGGPGGLTFKAGDRLEVEPRIGEAWWPAVLVNGGQTGMVPQNFIKAIAPIIGPSRGAIALRGRAFGPQPQGPLSKQATSTASSDQFLALPPLSLEEWAKTVNDGFAKVEKLPASWGKLSSSATAAPPLPARAKRLKHAALPAPWPLRVRLRGFERLFAVPGIERCGYLQVRVELIFGGQVIEKKLSKPVKRNSVLRFEDEWFYFSKFAAELNLSSRITLTLLGLDVSGPMVPTLRSPSFDDADDAESRTTPALTATGSNANLVNAVDAVRRMDSNNTLMNSNKDAGLGSKITSFFGMGRKTNTPVTRLRGATGSISVQNDLPQGAGGKMVNVDALGTAGDSGEPGSAKEKELELAGVSFPLWGADLTLKGGVMSFGLWPGQGGDRMLYCVENYEHDAPRVLVELDRYADPIRYQMPPGVPLPDPSLAPSPAVKPTPKKPADLPKKVSEPKGMLGRADAPPKKPNNRRQSVSVFVARQHNPDLTALQLGGVNGEKPQPSKKVQELLARDPLQMYQMTEVEKSLLWSERELLVNDPFALSKVMLSVNWINPVQRDQALQILAKWAQPAPMQAMELLDARFGEYRLREYAVKCLEDFDDEELSDFLLQLIQVLKFEAFHDSPLARFLFRRALANPREIGNKLFWGLRAEMHVKKSAPRFGLILKAYLRACGPHFAELAQQHDAQELLKSVAKTAQKMKNVSKAERTALARQAIAQVNERMPRVFELPLDPRIRASRFNPEHCRIMSSKKRPLWMSLESVDPVECGGEPMLVMFKVGDDLRQDQMTLQIIRVLEQIWLAEGMNMRLTPYGCISTGDELGMLQIVPDSETIAHIETTQGGTFGSLKDTPIRKFLEYHNKGSMDQAIDNFVRSCAGYCVATYIIGLGDRHNDNILCCRDGRLFHIDFGHFLGNFKTVAALGGFKRERTPFVLTKGMAYAMGGKGTEEFTRFVELCCKAFNIIRSHGDELVTLFRLMVPAGMPELKSDEDIQYLVDQLHLGKSDDEANKIFEGEINAAIGDFYRRVDNFLHTIKHS